MNFGPAVPRWKPSFYVYRFVLLFSLILSTLVRDRERRTRHGFITGRDWKTEAKPGRDPRRLSPAFLLQLRSGSHNQPSFCVFLLFFCSFLTLSANITSSCTPTITTTTTTTKIPIRKERDRERQEQRKRERGNTDRPIIRAKIDTNRTRTSAAISVCYDAVVFETRRNLR